MNIPAEMRLALAAIRSAEVIEAHHSELESYAHTEETEKLAMQVISNILARERGVNIYEDKLQYKFNTFDPQDQSPDGFSLTSFDQRVSGSRTKVYSKHVFYSTLRDHFFDCCFTGTDCTYISITLENLHRLYDKLTKENGLKK